MRALSAGILGIVLQAGIVQAAAGQSTLPSERFANLRFGVLFPAPATFVATQPVRRSPGVARFAGGLVMGSAALVGLLAATWDDADAVPAPVGYVGFAAGTAIGTSLATAIWEKPNSGVWIGSALGALPLILAMTLDNDGAASAALATAWVAAPVGAALGQRARRKPR